MEGFANLAFPQNPQSLYYKFRLAAPSPTTRG